MLSKQFVTGVLISLGVSACGVEDVGIFDYLENGADWPLENPLCGTGLEQSPIDLTKRGAWPTNRMDRDFWNYENYHHDELEVFLKEHTVQVNFDDGVMKLRDHFVMHSPAL